MEREVKKSSELTQAFKKLTYGFYIMSSKYEEKIAAGTVSWVSQVSFEPPLIMAAVKKDIDLAKTVNKSGVFAINIIGKAELKLIPEFSKDTLVENGKLNGEAFEEGETKSPLLTRLPAFLEAKVVETVDKGDHTIFIGEVVNAGVRNTDAEPLMEWETDYHYGG
ncbi:flavin reductase [Marivirga lumbricoides]|uniref:Flavin reductase n=1 Tax=Marivirga lumbricoides TaxID=1046115 RepID=A0ABQ1M7Z7_9BACT|nr:flavin reductase [Marivirga lumbricoides]